MTPKAQMQTCTPKHSVHHAMSLMVEQGFRHVPVVSTLCITKCCSSLSALCQHPDSFPGFGCACTTKHKENHAMSALVKQGFGHIPVVSTLCIIRFHRTWQMLLLL